MTTSAYLGMIASLMLVCSLTACGVESSEAFYEGPPAGAITNGSGPVPVDPYKSQVNSNAYPLFQIVYKLPPPEIRYLLFGYPVTVQMITIDPSYTWRVTHVIANKYLIESDEYNDRECRFLAKNYPKTNDANVNIFGECMPMHNYGIFVTPNGEISGGWQLLPGSRLVGSNRYMYFDYDPAKDAGWPKGKLFVHKRQTQRRR